MSRYESSSVNSSMHYRGISKVPVGYETGPGHRALGNWQSNHGNVPKPVSDNFMQSSCTLNDSVSDAPTVQKKFVSSK